jgi:deazaflavin-dependent oxidoreductase (nitroreductase family)
MASSTYSAFNDALIEDLRANGGQATSGPFMGRQVLILTTTGARTGEPRTVPLVYSRDGELYVIVASKGGAPTDPIWYRNLVANPIVTIEVGGETFKARATTVAPGPERDRLYAQHALPMPAFLDYQRKTERVIPVVVLERA